MVQIEVVEITLDNLVDNNNDVVVVKKVTVSRIVRNQIEVTRNLCILVNNVVVIVINFHHNDFYLVEKTDIHKVEKVGIFN